jgi:hypothetical protein
MKRLTIIAMIISVALVCFTVAVPICGAAQGGKPMGYCFDAAFHEKTSRLFVAGGDRGTHVFEVADGKFKFITTVADGGYHRNLKIAGDRLYLADMDRGLVVFDITGREPVRTWQQPGTSGLGLDVQGHYAYLAAGGDGLHIFDISAPDAPRLTGKCRTNGDAWDVWVNGPCAYVADLQKGVTVVDVSQPAQPKTGRSVTWDDQDPSAEIIRGEGKIVCIGAGKHGLVVADISNPQIPKVVSQYKSGEGSFGEGLCIRDGLVYLANGNEDNGDENGLIVVDARNPQALKVRGKCTFPRWVEGVCLAGHQAFVTNTYAGVRSIDVRDPDHPRLTDSFGPRGGEQADPLLTSAVSPEETRAIEEFRRIKARILAGESYTDSSTPLHEALTQFSAWGPGDARDYFMSLDIFRAPLPPANFEEGRIWPIFAGSGEVQDTFVLTCSKGQWIWLGNMGNPGDWRPFQSKIEEHARQEIAKRTAAVGSAGPETPAPPTAGAPGTNRVLELDGKTSFVRIADSPSLHTFANAITIETWFKAASLSMADQMINCLVRKNVAMGQENFLLRFRTLEGAPRVEMSPGLDIGALRASYPFAIGKWYHLAGVYDGSAITVYVNGAKIASETASGRMRIDNSDLLLGKGDPEFSNGEYFHGALDETRLWNVARSQEEIRAAMNTTLTGKEEGLVAYWSFDDGTAKDLSGHGNDGKTYDKAKAEPEFSLNSEAGPRERAMIELLQKTKGEILAGRKFDDLSTPGGAFLTLAAACRYKGEALFDRVAPIARGFSNTSEIWSSLLHGMRAAVVRRVETGNETPRESDLCSVYTSEGPNEDIDQIWSFGYVEGAWRFLNCTVPTDTWMSHARKNEARTREILQKGTPPRRSDSGQAGISDEIAVVTGLPLTVEILDWDISLQTDLPSDRLKIKAICTVRNKGQAPLDSLDFDLLAAEKFYGLHVEIAKIAGLSGTQETSLAFKRFAEQLPGDPDKTGTREYPLITRVPLPSPLQPGADCRLAFDYSLTCPDINKRFPYNPIWEPEEGKKEVCLIADYTWFPDLAADLQRRIQFFSKKNFFLRGSKPAWQVTLTHPAELEGMVIDGKLEKTERAGKQTVSRWKSIVGGKPQVFIGPAERIEKKGEKATVVFLLPKGKYDPGFVDGVAELVLHAYSVYTDWFGPIGGNEVHIVSPAGIRGGHGAFLGMTIDASYFRMKRSERLTTSGKFFAQTPVHELAHSWWPESYGRGTKFLREGLGNFATWHLAREYYGMDIFTSTLQQGILGRGQGGKPLFNPTGDEEQFAYVKGPLVLDMLRQEMGSDVFFRTLKEYVQRYKDRPVTFVDFVAVCNEVSQRDWMPFLYQWCYGKGCPGYHLVGFESKQGSQSWETTVTIRNDGTGIVRCPLELRMEGAGREEAFALAGGKEHTYIYLTEKKVTDVVIDPKHVSYQDSRPENIKAAADLVNSVGYGPKSNQQIASQYDKSWLEQFPDAGLLLKTGFALYDVKRYEDALAAFQKMEEKTAGDRFWNSVALIWQGHMLDLLGKRKEAIRRYEEVAAMGLDDGTIQHDQFGITYTPSPYARQRMDTPFTRMENRDED